MAKKETGGPAFPTLFLNSAGDTHFNSTDGGMSLRDYFAAKAMQRYVMEGFQNHEIAAMAYGVADAMLKERTK